MNDLLLSPQGLYGILFIPASAGKSKNNPMKNLLLVLCLLSVQAIAQNSKSITKTEIKEVKIFQNGAEVDRTIKTVIDAGVTELNVEGLSANIDKNSISVSGTEDAVLLSVVHQLNYLNAEKKTTEQVRLEDTLELLQNEQEKITGTMQVYNDEQSLLQANKSVGGANVGVSMENLQKVADFFRARMIDLKTKLMELQHQQKKVSEKITRVQQQLAELNTKRNQPTSTISITVSSKIRASISFSLSYYVTGAGWTPQYDVRAKDIKSPVQIAYKANVFQSTGEEWNDVKLKLSTGNPSQSGNKPVLIPWYLDFYRPVYREEMKNSRPAVLNNNQGNGGSGSEAETYSVDGLNAKESYTTANYTAVDENQLSTDFDISIPYSIPSDGKTHAVDIQSYNLKATYSYFAVPKLDKDAFLLARITGWEELNLLPGKASVYFEGAYVGESFIDARSTKDTLDLSLGRDKRIGITREKKKDLSTTTFMGGNVEKELNYLVTVRNTKKENVTIILEDQVPVSKNGDITVKDMDYSGGSYDSQSGKITWKIEVAPMASVEKKISFIVKYPKDKTIKGL